MKVGVIGAGAWGTALAIVCAQGGADVVLWSYDGAAATFDGVDTPNNLKLTCDMGDLGDADVWLAVTPSSFFADTMACAREFYNGVPVIICTKGAESKTGRLMTEIMALVLPECTDLGVLSGPQFAAEVARGVPTGSTLAGNSAVIQAGRAALNKLYISPSDDVIGTQICGVGKNAVALIAGYASVAGAGENERALIFTRAWDDVAKIGVAMGAKIETFMDLCGIGDLFLSATSPTSRNFSGGMAIARGNTPDGTVEGIGALRGLISRATSLGVKTPVLTEMAEKLGI